MNKYLKVLSLSLALTSAAYLPNANAASSTEMLITIAETNPVLVERLNIIALNDAELLNQLLIMAKSKPELLERLMNLAETDPEMFARLVTIFNVKRDQGGKTILTNMGIEDNDGDIDRV